MKSKKIIFHFRAYNDIDHMTPIIYKIKTDYPTVDVECIVIDLKNDFLEDFRVQFLLKLNVKVYHIIDYFEISKHIKAFLKLLIRYNSKYEINKFKKSVAKVIFHIFRNMIVKKLNNISVEKYVDNLTFNFNSIFIFDITFNKIYEKICKYLDKKGIISVAVPHGHNIFGNELISTYSLGIQENQGVQNSRLPFSYVVFENLEIAKRYLKIGYVNKSQIKVLGTSRFSNFWLTKIREILPKSNLPKIEKKLKVVFMLTKPLYNIFTDEIKRSILYVASFPGTFVIIKPHTRGEVFENLKNHKNIKVVDNNIPSSSLIDWSNVICFTNTSIIFESLKLNKPLLYLKNTHANKLFFENNFKSWQIECRDDLRRHIWNFLKDNQTSTYTIEERNNYLSNCIEPIGKEGTKYYSNFIYSLFD